MNLSAANYWRLAKVYPLERKPDEALYVSRAAEKRKDVPASCEGAVWIPESKTFARCGDHPKRRGIFASEVCLHLDVDISER